MLPGCAVSILSEYTPDAWIYLLGKAGFSVGIVSE